MIKRNNFHLKNYNNFLSKKSIKSKNFGFKPYPLHETLFEFQKDLTNWAIKKGKAALWAGTGLGKTRMQVSWAKQIYDYTGKPVLILAPLAVANQTIDEAKKIGIKISKISSKESNEIKITNYEQLHNINPDNYIGIVLDESGILKNFASKYKNTIINLFSKTPYKLCCSATPSPNDFIEIGNHAEFLNVCTRSEMLATFFVHDSGETQKWRLKKHAKDEFFKWLSTWAIMISKPSDLGYPNGKYDLPELVTKQHIVESKKPLNSFFPVLAKTLNERRQARKESIKQRCELAAKLSKDSKEPWLYWCDLIKESSLLTKLVENSIEITGSMKNEIKEERLLGFASGKYQKIITKPKIAQFGLNWQHCNNMVFVGLSDSFEAMYQAIRRCWRFGQKKRVNVHIIISDREGNVLHNIQRKERNAEIMLSQMVKYMMIFTEIKKQKTKIEYKPKDKLNIPDWLK